MKKTKKRNGVGPKQSRLAYGAMAAKFRALLDP